MKVSVTWANEQIELLGRLVYHYKVEPIRLEMKPLNMHASIRSLGIALVNMHYLYCAMCLSRFDVLSYSLYLEN